mmetsp:Transcript_25573/g.75070  ORF Transcript_25573/g.75070 Transcript_25573/m.75070 type:complete len:287 (+) Transcript_25573:3-863(+)
MWTLVTASLAFAGTHPATFGGRVRAIVRMDGNKPPEFDPFPAPPEELEELAKPGANDPPEPVNPFAGPSRSVALDGSMVADYGFDPLNLAATDLNLGSAEDKARSPAFILRDYRDAELRHGRLAMLAALGWPVQELVNPAISRALREPMLLVETGGRSPSVLNGGLEQGPVPYALAFFALLIGAVDAYSIKLKEEKGDSYVPGDFGFDPLNIMGGASLDARRDMQEKEINNGRLAMVAVTAYVIEEAIAKQPIVSLTPLFFKPFFLYPEVQEALNNAFQVASFRTG